MNRCCELIRELIVRGVALRLGDGGRIYANDPSKIADLLPELKRHRKHVLDYVNGSYLLTIESLCRELGNGPVHGAILRDLYSDDVLNEGRRARRVIVMMNGFYRLPDERDTEKAVGKRGRKK